MRFASAVLASAALLAAAPVHAKPADPEAATKILKDSVAIPTVEGRGKVPELAAYYAGVLKAAAYADADIEITPTGETATYHPPLPAPTTQTTNILHCHLVVHTAAPTERNAN